MYQLRYVKFFKNLALIGCAFFLLNGADLPKKEKSKLCSKKDGCLTTFVSPGAIIVAQELDLSLVRESPPAALDKIDLILDKNKNFVEVKVAENVYYYKAVWQNRIILLSRFDLDISKSLRTFGSESIQVFKEPKLSSVVLGNLEKNTAVDVLENTHPLTEKKGFVKVKTDTITGWIKRSSLSDDEYDIQFHLVDFKTLVRPYIFVAKENDFNISLNIVGNPFIVGGCKIGEDICSSTTRMGTSSFGMPQEAVYFDLKTDNGKAYICEIRREDFLGELQRVIQGDITEEELDPFMNCSVDQGEDRQSELDAESEEK